MESTFSGADAFLAQQIENTPTTEDPFEHCVIDDALPQHLFEEIHRRWLSGDAMKPLPETGRSSHYPERYIFLLEDQFLSRMDRADQEFWIGMAEAVMGPSIIRACYKKFERTLLKRVEHLDQKTITLDPEMLVVSDRKGYRIGPHTDSKARFVSMLLYLSPDPKYRSYGTGLYTPRDPKMLVNDRQHYGFEHFNLQARVDYKPNRAVIFPRTDRSYHGVEPVPVADCDRRLIIVNIRAPNGAR
ncbi:MAG: 2OG-Fe(II) oxygenase family protein [Rhodospirillales bacterium]|jgi:hypothetical protein